MSIDYRDSSTLSVTENSTVVQNKIVNSNFYSYTICRIEVEMIAISFNVDKNWTIIQLKCSGELS